MIRRLDVQAGRRHAIRHMRLRLERDGYPRLQMLLLVMMTGAAGFIASYLLLWAGIDEMWFRYLLALGIAYLTFLMLLWLWLRTRAQDGSDFPDLSGLDSGHGHNESPAEWGGQGGGSGGGGASSSFDAPSGSGADVLDDTTTPIGEALGAVSDADELAIPLMALLLVAALVLSSLFVVYSAPILFAELLVDGVLATSLYRRLRGLEPAHWLETAVRRTFLPFVLTAAFVVAAGWGMARYAPGADSIGDVLAHARQSE